MRAISYADTLECDEQYYCALLCDFYSLTNYGQNKCIHECYDIIILPSANEVAER